MKNRGIFITATDTGVGKTVCTAVLAALLRSRGIKVGVMKPVTSGCIVIDGKLVSEDAELLKWAAGATAPDGDISPYLLSAPLAPSVSAFLDGVEIRFQTIREAYERLAASHDIVLVEGAGGLMVPLTESLLVSDLILYLGLPAIIIACPNLGTVNHTLMTCFCAQRMGIGLKGIIINNYPECPGEAEQYAPSMIETRSNVPVIGSFPHVVGRHPAAQVGAILEKISGTPLEKALEHLCSSPLPHGTI
ncbi:MAG: dethiobiotin synthase [Geobacteraceae bacterium]|nr:dethiobiotin synthase [Geobacteraceae bacterium]